MIGSVVPDAVPEDGEEDRPRPAATQQIRLAVVLNGGVSLAVWISGVTHELNQLVQASRRRGTREATPDAYADLLEVLDAEARIDVIAGTSAGGLNGGFLSLGLVHGCDLSGLRRLWQEQGSLSILLRDPQQKDQPSLLRGEYFHQKLADAYAEVWDQRTGAAAAPGEDVDLFLTGTLWDGRRSFFADDMGRRITETDHDATFHFTSDREFVTAAETSTDPGDLCSRAVTAQLGRASRCTASFPAAFEPFPVNVLKEDQERDGRWASDAGRANFQRSQFVIDGGILRNKPIRPAIDAVYRQPADQQVRRILTYVVPDPGEAATGPGRSDVTGPPPGAADVMLGVMTRLRSTDSVAEELAEIQRRNDETTNRRGARDRLAQTLVAAARPGAGTSVDLVGSAYPGYLDVRRADTAQSVARLLLSAPGQPPWSQREVAAELRVLAESRAADPQRDTLPFIPPTDQTAAFDAVGDGWRWGQATVRRLGDVVLDVLKRAVWLAPLSDGQRQTIVDQRAATHGVLLKVREVRKQLDAYWRRTGPTAPPVPDAKLPARGDGLTATPRELKDLRDKLAVLAEHWGAATEPDSAMTTLHGLALELAQCLLTAGPALRGISTAAPAVVDEKGIERDRLRALVDLLVPEGAADADAVLRTMLRLEVVHVAFTGVSDVPEQAVELVQISSLDNELVTGTQLHHFGAFYRQSWRANDWVRGRVDGCEQLVQALLAPERLRQLYGHDATRVLEKLQGVAVGPEDGTHWKALTAEWVGKRQELIEELQVLEHPGPLPRTFPHIAARIARRIKTELLPDELDAFAAAVEDEPDPLDESLRWAKDVRAVIPRSDAATTTLGPSQLDSMLQASSVIGRQTIAAEAKRGSDTFAQTAAHAAASLTATASSLKKPKAAVSLLTALRGYALLVWVLVNFLAFRSNFGRNLTSLVVGVGGALIALAVVVPGVPTGVPLAGVLLVLGTASAAVLLPGRSVRRGYVWRLGLLLVVAGLALWVVLRGIARSNKQTLGELLWDILLRAALFLIVLAVGWILGRPSPRKKA